MNILFLSIINFCTNQVLCKNYHFYNKLYIVVLSRSSIIILFIINAKTYFEKFLIFFTWIIIGNYI